MLQPREQHRIPFLLVLFRLTLCIAFICIKTGLAQHSDDVYIVEPTPALRLNSQDLTTILLLNNNNNRANYGRHSNPKPTVGLLTSTARTFIQEGVTTEYATQVLGTTLDNGRLYAQLLKKSSRVLYDKSQPSIAPTAKFPGAVQSLQTFSAKNPKSILQSHNDIIGDKDWQLIDDHLLLINNDMHPKTEGGGGNADVTRSNGSLLVFPARSIDNGEEYSNNDQFSPQRFGNYNFSTRSTSQSSSSSNARGNISAQKVLHPGNLPTYTVKNIFAPSGFSWDSPIEDTYLVEDKGEAAVKVRVEQQQRTPKLLQHENNILNNKLRNMVTTTYFGFADFTTIVGDTVIVFSPSTAAEHGNQGQVTSIKGEATLNDSPQETAFVTHVPITVTQDLIEPTFTMQQVVETVQPTQSDLFNEQQEHLSEVLNEDNEEGHDQSDLTMPEDPNDYSSDDDNSAEEYVTTTEGEAPEETTPLIDMDQTPDEKNPETDIVPVVLSSSIELEPSIVAAPEDGTSIISYTTETPSKVMLSKPSNEDISKIFASLASVEAAKKLAASQAAAETSQITPVVTTGKPDEVASPAPTTASTTDTPLENDTTEQIEKSQQPDETVETTTQESVVSSSGDHDKAVENIDSYTPTFPNSIEVDEEESIVPETTSAETKVSGGVTTIFFEDDPFLGFEPTTTLETSAATAIIENSTPTQTATTEAPISETSQNSEVPEDTTDAPKENTDVNTKSEVNEDEIQEKDGDECQEKTSEVIPTLLPKTLTYLTTFFISDAEETSTSVESNVVVTFDVSYSTKLYCMEIISSSVVDHQMSSTDSTIKTTLDESTDHSSIDHTELSSSLPATDDEEIITTTPHMIITEKAHITTEQTPSTEIIKEGPSPNVDGEESSDETSSEQSDEEIELIYKTLFTTYTYLTTFFHESTTSVSSRKEIITNVITSTVSPSQLQNSGDVTDILASISPSIVQDEKEMSSTETTVKKAAVDQSDLVKIDNILREDEEQISPTTSLDEVNGDAVKTYYTTYTYFTTIFVDGETEIMSRTEVYTNLVSDSADNIEPSLREKDSIELTVRDDDNKIVNDITPTNTYFPQAHTNTVRLVQQALSELSQDQGKYKNSADPIESSIISSSISSSADDSEIVMVTDIKSSSSDGDRHIIENINKHWNGPLEDQISSESNTDEILPSSTLLLQTSYTTFTYFTTMYIGSTASNILSRLETITNVVTETLQPTQMLKAEDSTLPITYFTTFTYWTTLYKDGETTTISREETVSNIVTPTAVLEQQDSTTVLQSSAAPESILDSNTGPVITEAEAPISTETNSSTSYDTSSSSASEEVAATTVMKHLQPTTFYTTYTYFTTQYVGDETVISSRYETVTNVNTPLVEEAASSSATVESSSPLSLESTDINLPVSEIIASTTEAPLDESIIEINQGRIVDAEGISTLLYTTKRIATQINGEPTTIVMSTSSLNIDEAKKELISSTQTDSSTRTYKTGLVRLIDGTIVANLTTTLYQSKVIGTIIDGRYAQIIESTSSFLIDKTIAPSTPQVEISPTAVKDALDDVILQTAFTPTASTNPVEGSINDGAEEKEQDQFEDNGEDEDDTEFSIDESGRPKSRLTFQTKKKTFTPVIRPFASRNRPQFAPKRKNGAGGSATIITRSDFTPTITATPALKSESSRGRFSSNRKGGSSILSSGAVSGSSRKFSRPGSISSARGFASSSAFQGSSRRGFSSSRIQPSASSYFPGGSRRGGVSSQRPSAGSSNFGRPGASSLFPGNSRLRIKPTSISLTGADGQTNTNIYTTQEPDILEDNATQLNSEQEQDDVEVTTETLRRPNSLVKLRRPPIVGKNLGISPRRNPLTQKPKTTTTTSTTPKPQPRAFQRPSLPAFGNRPRTSSGLFPPRGLFKPQTLNDDLSSNKKDDEGNDFGDDLDPDEYDDEDDEEIDEDLDRNRRNNVKRHIRAKRQAPSFRNRFRRPSSGAKNEEKAEPVQEEPVTQRSRTTARFNGSRNSNKKSNQGKNHNNNNSNNNKNNNNSNGGGRIRPTKASSTSRAQFTLREKDTATKPSRSSSFRRPTTNSGSSGSRRTATTAGGRPKAPRLKTYANSVTEAPYSSRSTAGRSRQTTSRGRATTRSRGTTEFKNNDPVLPVFDGTITVTHHIPTEVTIPVVNGKVTEYKNIITAQIRTEVLAPNQYNTLVDRAGSSLLVLAREDSTVNGNGATEVTQFILHETPTTSVIFTPTTIRGRKTSFSHIIPSTVYDVENVVSTIQPQIAAQAPLANILLSQLLLGNIGLPQQQLNPALIGLGQTGAPGTPTTEFKTRTTSYVTTVTNEMSTVIPLTFRGKEILTTIFDSSVNVITATEYITDTIVVTPAAAAVQQVNSLLLPLLLQQQAQGAQPLLPIQNSIAPQPIGNDPLLNTVAVPQQNLFQDNNFRSDADLNRIQQVNLDDFHDTQVGEEFPEQETFREAATETSRSRKRHHRKGNKHNAQATSEPDVPQPALETSVVTLYVSGRRPGEFSTILSTVVGQEGSLRKRHAEFIPVETSATVDYSDIFNADETEIKEYLLPASNDILLIASSQLPTETQSLESIVGDVSRWFETQSDSSLTSQASKTITSDKMIAAPVKTSEQNDSKIEHFLV